MPTPNMAIADRSSRLGPGLANTFLLLVPNGLIDTVVLEMWGFACRSSWQSLQGNYNTDSEIMEVGPAKHKKAVHNL